MPADHLIVAVDGPAGVGKTTLARQLAQKLGIAFLDTGAMFRAVGWMMGPDSLSPQDSQVEQILKNMNFRLEGAGNKSFLTLNSKKLGPEIRNEDVGMWASNAGKLEKVRTFLKKEQQKIGKAASIVAEGRDMGSVVFPNAPYKFFLDAQPEVRARRRQDQLKRMGKDCDFKIILQQIIQRDHQDRNRSIAPLKAAPDAIIIDTSVLSQDQVFEAMIRNIH